MGKGQPYVDIIPLHSEVTGSCLLLIIKFPDGMVKRIIIDCGLFQEREYMDRNKVFPFDADKIDHVFITHAHTDHVGRLAKLVGDGYSGKIHATNSSAKILPYALGDCYKLMISNAKLNRLRPDYSENDLAKTLTSICGHPYSETLDIEENIKVTFFMNGHLPGASLILVQISYYDDYSPVQFKNINLLFTGDYHYKNKFFDVEPIPDWVYDLPITIITESTYGTTNSSEIEYVFENNILNAISEGKEIVIPVFSLARSQEILYTLKEWQESGKLDRSIPIYLDGKLCFKYTGLYQYDGLDNREEARDFLPDNLTFVNDLTLRRKIMNDGEQKIIVTTSGMGTHGPAQTYLPAYTKRENVLIHFTGYCAKDTMGRCLIEAPKGYFITKNKDGEWIYTEHVEETEGLILQKKADVKSTSEYSSHAKADELINLLDKFNNKKLILVNHGESDVKTSFAARLNERYGDKTDIGILDDCLFRVDGYGYVKSFPTKFYH